MADSNFAGEQRKFLIEQFDHARRYLQIILGAGYAGLFALWTGFDEHLSPLAKLASGLLTSISIMVFLGWEIYSMVKRQEVMAMTRMIVDEPKRFEQNFIKIHERLRAIMAQLERSWWTIILFASSTAALAYFVVLSSFAIDLITQLAPKVSQQQRDFAMNALWIAASIALGSLLVVLVVRIDSSISRRANRKHFAEALSEDLDTFRELIRHLDEHWRANGVVDVESLQEIAYSRRSFDDNRGALHILNVSELQSRLSSFYRKSFGLLSRLQADSNYFLSLLRAVPNSQAILDPVVERERVEREISNHLSGLLDLVGDAADLSEKLLSHR
jgi:hypothetical protein